MSLDRQIEAVLFYKAEPVKRSKLATWLEVSQEELPPALEILRTRLEGGATCLVATDDEVELVIKPDFSSLIENLRQDDMRRDIGKAGAETLAVVLYRGPVTRIEIDRIRGVNSTYILRQLEARGLVERSTNKRRIEFKITPELLRHLGVKEKSELPDYAKVMNALEAYEVQNDERE